MLRKVMSIIVMAALVGHAGLTIAASGNPGNAKKFNTKKRAVKRTVSDPRQLRIKAENDGKHHENESRYRNFQLMQQAQQRGYQAQQPPSNNTPINSK